MNIEGGKILLTELPTYLAVAEDVSSQTEPIERLHASFCHAYGNSGHFGACTIDFHCAPKIAKWPPPLGLIFFLDEVLTIDSIARTWIGNAIEIVFAILVTVT